MNAHKFYWKGPPRPSEYIWVFVTLTLAAILSSVLIWTYIHGSFGEMDVLDRFGMWVIASASWLLPAFFWSTLAVKRRQFRDRIPALIVSKDGLSITDWRGKPIHLAWPGLALRRDESHGNDDLWIRSGGVSGAVSLMDLDQPAGRIVDIINQYALSA